MPTEKPRLMVTLEDQQRERVRDFQHAQKIPSMSKAMVELIARGLDIVDRESEEAKQAEIVALADSELRQDEAKLISAYRKLNSDGQHMALGMVESLTLNPAYTQDTSQSAG